jgi:tRNA (mo5U34)-methyltransferase
MINQPHPAEISNAVAAWGNWYHQIEVAPGVVTPGTHDSQAMLERIGLPANLADRRTLDLGTRDGFFAFECERRGASVIAVDYLPAERTGFSIAADLLHSKVQYHCANVYNLTPQAFGEFDLVLMLGLLYHLPDPLGALAVVRTLCRGKLILETHVADAELGTERPLMAFCQGDSLNGDWTNYWAPNTLAVEAMLREVGFTIESTRVDADRAIIHAAPIFGTVQAYYHRVARGAANPRW